jgi:ABC-type phosphate/phosphonate transport system substrate-binding protein
MRTASPLQRLFASTILAMGLSNPSIASAETSLILAVSEGSSGGLDHSQVIAKYKGLADVIGRALKTNVQVVFAREFSTLENDLKESRFAFVMARPSDYPARGMRDYGYHFVASAKPDGQCFIITPGNSPIKKLEDIKGKRIVFPEKMAYMSRFCAAELRTKGILVDNEKVTYVREQAAVGFYLDNNFGDVGVVASYSGIAKTWEKDGKVVLHKSVSQPYFPMVAASTVRPEQIKAIQRELLTLTDNVEGQELLKRIGIKAFDVESEPRMRELLGWLG